MKKKLIEPTVIVGSKKPIIMEVVGEKGQKICEYEQKDDEPEKPYHLLHESAQIDV